MNEFDQTARQASKSDGAGFLSWVVRHNDPVPPHVFERWDDTRRKSWEGGPDRTNDLVAVLRHPDRADNRLWLIVEFESDPERFIFQRLGLYELLLSMEIAQQLGLAGGVELPVGSVVLHLTGERDSPQLRLRVPGTNRGTLVAPLSINLQQESAAATLADIAAGRVACCILAWIPLMAGGGDPALIEEWKRLVFMEPDLEKQAQYRSWAPVFAELTREQVNWHQALEGWEMLESKVIGEWKHEGEMKGIFRAKRGYLLELVRIRLQDPVPETIRLAVEGTNDPDTLDRWFNAVANANTLTDLLNAMK